MPESTQQLIRFETETAIRKAQEVFGITLPRIPVRMNLKGQCAGQFWPMKYFRFNVELLSLNPKEIRSTCWHEVGHYVTRFIYGHSYLGKKVQPHGKEWKSVMRSLGQEPERCHNMDVSKTIVRKQKRHEYICKCKTFKLTTTRHNKILKGKLYRCKVCGETLRKRKRGEVPEYSS